MKLMFNPPACYVNENPNITKYIQENISKDNQHYVFLGAVGCGKTYLAQLLSDRDTKFVECRNVYEKYLTLQNGTKSDKAEAMRKAQHVLRGKDVIFDDLGDERDSASSHYFIGSLLEDRYNWIKKGLAERTIITTNLTPKDISTLYGHRVIDRLQEVFVFLHFKNKSFRNRNARSISG